jgi:hypothetical protein
VVSKKAFSGATAVFCLLLIVLGIGSATIYSTPALGDDLGGILLPPAQSPIIDTTTADSLHTANIGTPSAGTSTLLTDIAIMIISLI